MAIPQPGFSEFLLAHAESHADRVFCADFTIGNMSESEIESRLLQMQPRDWADAEVAMQWLISNCGLTASQADAERAERENFPMQMHLLLGIRRFLGEQQARAAIASTCPEVAKAA